MYKDLLLSSKAKRPIPNGQRIFSTSSTFIVPEDVTRISIVCIGGGGAGARGCLGGSCGNGNGGGGGALAYMTLDVEPFTELVITVGGGGGASHVKRGSLELLYASGGSNGSGDSGNGGGSGGTGRFNSSLGQGNWYRGGKGGGNAGWSRTGWGGGAGRYFENGLDAPYYGSSAPTTPKPTGTSLLGGTLTDTYGLGGQGGQSGYKGGVRIIWGENRYYPNTNTQNR